MSKFSEVSLKVWKQQKLIDLLEESEEVDVYATIHAYDVLASLHREVGDEAAAEDAEASVEALLFVQTDFSRIEDVPESCFYNRPEVAVDADTQPGYGSDSELKEGGEKKKEKENGGGDEDADRDHPTGGFRFDKHFSSGHGRPTSAAIRQSLLDPNGTGTAADVVIPRPRSMRKRLSVIFQRSDVGGSATMLEALDKFKEAEKVEDKHTAIAVAAAYKHVMPHVEKLLSDHNEGRDHVRANCLKTRQKLLSRVVHMLETKVAFHADADTDVNIVSRIADSKASNGLPDSDNFVFWHDELFKNTDALVQEHEMHVKEQLRRQVDVEKAAWMKMSQQQLDATQKKYGASEAATHVDVLVHEFKKAEADMTRWELGVLGLMRSVVGRLMDSWHERAKPQADLERAMRDLRRRNIQFLDMEMP
jgi:hypothetical protein